MSKTLKTTLLAGLLCTAPHAMAQKLCVYDLLGSAGDIFNMAKDFAVDFETLGCAELRAALTP